VAERGSVDQDAIGRFGLGLDEIDQRALVVGLEAAHVRAQRSGALGDRRLDTGQRLPAVDLRLALAQDVEVGAVDE
jgi:hypothetical protein